MTTKTLYGVNLGGWLLLEKWMTPSLFEGTTAQDEYELLQTPDGKEKIERHHRSFITEDDFKWLHTHGINAVRIPIGYWALKADSPFIAVEGQLDWAFVMAEKYKLQVIIDLHGLKGSQNGKDHSGKVGKAQWYRSSQYRQETLDTLEAIARRYRDNEVLWGLQIVNEPKIGIFQLTLRRFYKEAYHRLDSLLKPHTHIIFSDGFTPRLLSGAMGRHGSRVVMDVHLYHMATLFSQFLSVEWFMNKTQRRGNMLKRLSKTQPIIIGEWSGVLRHETMRRLPEKQQAMVTREYSQLQLKVYENVAGWFYWNYKTEGPGTWNFRSQVEDGLIELNQR